MESSINNNTLTVDRYMVLQNVLLNVYRLGNDCELQRCDARSEVIKSCYSNIWMTDKNNYITQFAHVCATGGGGGGGGDALQCLSY